MKAYSKDLRERVVIAVEEGKSRREVARLFHVSLSTVKRYIKQWREEGNIDPKPIPGRPSKKLASQRAKLQAQLEAFPDATLQEHCDMWEAISGVKVSTSTMSRAILYEKWTRKKKTLQASEQREEEREEWLKQVKKLDRRRFVFIDESGSNIALTRLYGRAPKGKRAKGSVPRNRGKNLTVIASLSLQGLGESVTLDGATNTEFFELYVEQFLAPSLKSGQIVIMDNLRAHKSQKTRQLIEARGCEVVFLPAYSPDFSPIEEAFSKVKAVLRRIGARTREALQEALEYALSTVSASDAAGWFSHCGYLPAEQETAQSTSIG